MILPSTTRKIDHFDRVTELYTQDHVFLRALFVATFEAVKTTSAVS